MSDGLDFRDVAALVGVEAVLLDAERACGRMGETSREFKGEGREVLLVVCMADVVGWLLESALIVEALDEDSRLRREGTGALAVASAEPVAVLAVVSMVKEIWVGECRGAFEKGTFQRAGREEWIAHVGCGGVSAGWGGDGNLSQELNHGRTAGVSGHGARSVYRGQR